MEVTSDAETTREGLTSDGFSKEAFSTPAEVTSNKSAISGEEVLAQLAALPVAWNTGEELTGGSPVQWGSLHEGSVYSVAEFIEGKYYPMLAFVVRLQGVQNGFIGSDGEQFIEAIKVPVEDVKRDADKYSQYVVKKEFLIAEMAKPARSDIDDIKDHVKVEYPPNYFLKKNFGFRNDGTCAHVHLAGVKRFRHNEGKRDENGEFIRKIKCDRLHMRYAEKTDTWEVCNCLSTSASSPALSPSVFQIVTQGAQLSNSGSSADAGNSYNSAIDVESPQEEECLTCRCIRLNANKNKATTKKESKENDDSSNMIAF